MTVEEQILVLRSEVEALRWSLDNLGGASKAGAALARPPEPSHWHSFYPTVESDGNWQIGEGTVWGYNESHIHVGAMSTAIHAEEADDTDTTLSILALAIDIYPASGKLRSVVPMKVNHATITGLSGTLFWPIAELRGVVRRLWSSDIVIQVQYNETNRTFGIVNSLAAPNVK